MVILLSFILCSRFDSSRCTSAAKVDLMPDSSLLQGEEDGGNKPVDNKHGGNKPGGCSSENIARCLCHWRWEGRGWRISDHFLWFQGDSS